MKALLVSSAGGHFSELKKIRIDKHETIVVTELAKGSSKSQDVNYYLKYSSRQNLVKYLFLSIYNVSKAIYILLKERPKLIISTGAHTCAPFIIFGKILGKKTIYIESFAKVDSSSLTYKIVNKFCDEVIVQHKNMQNVYEKSKYFGGIY